MSQTSKNESEEVNLKNVSSALERILNTHGYGFQFAVIKAAQDLELAHGCGWYLEASEIPVGKEGERIHVDFIFEIVPKSYEEERKTYLIGECKRVDPAIGDWIFVKSPRKFRYDTVIRNLTQFDSLQVNEGAALQKTSAKTSSYYTQQGIYELGFESRTTAKGDGIGNHERSAINQALGQVFRAQKGFINYLNDLPTEFRKAKLQRESTFIPAIFTTANLYTTDVQIDLANIDTGKLVPGSTEVKRVPWLWFNHNRFLDASPFRRQFDENDNRDFYFADFTRSVAIVGSSGLEEFMKMDLHSLLRRK